MSQSHFGCDSAKSRSLPINGLALHVLEWGRGGQPPMCFLHGGSAHAHWFDSVAPAFAERWHVVALDQRGHGESAWARPPAYATEDFAADLVRLFDSLGWSRVVLVGHSMGGHNAMSFAAWHPERVRALVVVDSRPAIPPERLEGMRQRGRRALRLHRTPEDAVAAFRLLPRETTADPALLRHLARMGVVERDGGWVYRFDPDANRQRRPADLWTLLGRITAPTLIVRGGLSPVMPQDLAQRMLSAISGARMVEIPGAYHHLVLDAPDAFTRVFSEFLASLR